MATWMSRVFLLGAVGLVLRALALISANSPALPLVLAGGFLPLALALVACLVLAVRALAAEWTAEDSERARPVALLRWMFVISIAGWLLFLAYVQPFQRLWFDLALGLAAGAFGALVLLQRWARGHWSVATRRLDVLAFSLCAGALGLELGLRVYAELQPSPMFARVGGGPGELVQRFRCKPGEVRFGFACNSRGFYDDEFYRKQPGEARRVVAIGDSFGVGAVPHAWHYSTLVEELTGDQLDNMGVAGIGPPEYLSLLVEEALPLNPDLILISVFVGNDLNVEDVLADLPDSGLRGWLQRDQVLLFVLPERLARVGDERQRLASRGSGLVPSAGPALPAMDREQAAAAFPWVADPDLEQASLSAETFHNLETNRALDICAQDPASLELLQSSLLAARHAAGDVPVLVMLIPDEFQVEDDLWHLVSERARRPLERDRPQRLLRAWLAENGFPTLDLLPVLRAVAPLDEGGRHVYHLLDTHFNARGNEFTARALAEFLGTQ